MGYRKFTPPAARSIVHTCADFFGYDENDQCVTVPGQIVILTTGEHLWITPYNTDDPDALFAGRLELIESVHEYPNSYPSKWHEPRVCREAFETASALALWLNAEFITPTCC